MASVQVQQRLCITGSVHLFGCCRLVEHAIDLSVVHGGHLAVGDEDVIPSVLRQTTHHVRVGVFENLVLAPARRVTNVRHVGVVAGTREDLVKVGYVEAVDAPLPLDHVDAAVANCGDAGGFATAVLEGTNE